MCGRYFLNTPVQALEAQFEAVAASGIVPRYNLAPSTPVAVVKEIGAGRGILLHHWGLIPSWAKDPAMGARLINARAETVADKPSFRASFRRRRCLVPASGFYEWQVRPGRPKQPWAIQAVSGEPLALAGLWDLWEGPDGCLESCTIITTSANGLMAPIHDRMPVILAARDWARWLEPHGQGRDLAALMALLRPCAEDLLRRYPIGPRVGKVQNDGPELLEPLEPLHG